MKGERSHFESKTALFPAQGVSALLFAMASLAALPAGAQRTDDNAVTAAGDAFGNTVGFAGTHQDQAEIRYERSVVSVDGIQGKFR